MTCTWICSEVKVKMKDMLDIYNNCEIYWHQVCVWAEPNTQTTTSFRDGDLDRNPIFPIRGIRPAVYQKVIICLQCKFLFGYLGGLSVSHSISRLNPSCFLAICINLLFKYGSTKTRTSEVIVRTMKCLQTQWTYQHNNKTIVSTTRGI